MGYNTTFSGEFKLVFPQTITEQEKQYLQEQVNLMAETRRFSKKIKFLENADPRLMRLRPKEILERFGPNGEFFIDKNLLDQFGQIEFHKKDNANKNAATYINSYNTSPGVQPSLHMDFEIVQEEDSYFLKWNGANKTYSFEKWFLYLYLFIFKPNDIKLQGTIFYQGEDRSDFGCFLFDIIEDFQIFNTYHHISTVNSLEEHIQLVEKMENQIHEYSKKVEKIIKKEYLDKREEVFKEKVYNSIDKFINYLRYYRMDHFSSVSYLKSNPNVQIIKQSDPNNQFSFRSFNLDILHEALKIIKGSKDIKMSHKNYLHFFDIKKNMEIDKKINYIKKVHIDNIGINL